MGAIETLVPFIDARSGRYAELSDRIRVTPAADLLAHRVSVPTRIKLAVLVRATAGSLR